MIESINSIYDLHRRIGTMTCKHESIFIMNHCDKCQCERVECCECGERFIVHDKRGYEIELCYVCSEFVKGESDGTTETVLH